MCVDLKPDQAIDANDNLKLTNFFSKADLNNSFIVGYYGNGNFGDELLLETLMILFSEFQFKDMKFMHFPNDNFNNWHKIPENYSMVSNNHKSTILKHIFDSRNIIVGGGGLWAADSSINILSMSFLLFFCRFILRKNVYLLGVGYYDSINLWGRVGAWFAGRSANLIIARDDESHDNFKRLNKNTFIDYDITFNLKKFDLSNYKNDVESLSAKICLAEKNVLFTIRSVEFSKNILQIVKNNPAINFIFLHFIDIVINDITIDMYRDIEKTSHDHPNLSVYLFDYNPVALLGFFENNADKIYLISAQYHGQIIAHLAGVKFLPISYSNKNIELFKVLKIDNFYNLHSLSMCDIQNEISDYVKT